MTLFGQDTAIASFLAALNGPRMPHAWLIGGPRGVGKATFARTAALRILSGASAHGVPDPGLSVPDDHPTAKLIEAGSHPDFRLLERLTNDKTGNLARNITVDQVRALRPLFANATALGDRRVIVIDSIDDMEKGAANATLKALEEPPPSTIFLLVSHAPGRLLPTIRSRCRALTFAPLDDAAMTSFLRAHHPDFGDEQRNTIIRAASGSPGAAEAAIELDTAAFDTALETLATTGDPSNAVRSKLAQSLSLKAAAPRYEAFLARAPTFIVERARAADPHQLPAALAAWDRAVALQQIAIPRSLVAESVVFEMAGYVASLARTDRPAKA